MECHPDAEGNEIAIQASFDDIEEQEALRVANIRQLTSNKIACSKSDRYTLGMHIQKGKYTDIFALVNKKDEVAQKVVKLEDKNTENPTLHYESKIYDLLKDKDVTPTKYGYFSKLNFRYLILQCMGPSLQDYLMLCGGTFSLQTVILIAKQLLNRFRSLHSKKIIFRDIKPESFMTEYSGNRKTEIYLVGFAMAKRFVDEKGNHIRFRGDKKIICKNCSLLYHSVNNLKGHELSRRDDLESLGYVLIHFLKGSLPWQGRPGLTESQNLQNISRLKESISPEELCEGLPKEFAAYMRYCRSLKFEQTPDYDILLNYFKILQRVQGYEENGEFDWEIKMALLKSQNSIQSNETPTI